MTRTALGHDRQHRDINTEMRREGPRPRTCGDHEVVGLEELARGELQPGDPIASRGKTNRFSLLHEGAQAFSRLRQAQGVLVRLDLTLWAGDARDPLRME